LCVDAFIQKLGVLCACCAFRVPERNM